jgi:hypothetical protein
VGHNRAGDNARLKERRRRREQLRLAHAAGPPDRPPRSRPASRGLVASVEEAAKGAVHKVGGLVKAAGRRIKKALE